MTPPAEIVPGPATQARTRAHTTPHVWVRDIAPQLFQGNGERPQPRRHNNGPRGVVSRTDDVATLVSHDARLLGLRADVDDTIMVGVVGGLSLLLLRVPRPIEVP